jgi:ribosome assembly protein YihI (activator of Der GTPase)
MITFILGALATIVVGVMVWLTVSTIGMISKVKHLETQQELLYKEINERFDAINHQLDQLVTDMNRRIDDNYSYTDSRLDKLETKLTKN